MAYDLKRNKGKVTDIKTNIEHNQETLNHLETTKENLNDARMSIEASDMDEDVKQAAIDSLNRSLRENSEEAKETSENMRADVEDIENLKQETQETMDSTASEQKKLEQKKAILDKFGMGNLLEESIESTEQSHMELEEFNESLIETGKELDEIRSKLGRI